MSEVADLIRAVIASDEEFTGSWDAFSVVIRLNDEGVPSGSNGYLYSGAHDFRAIAADPFDIRPAMAAYLRSVYGDGPRPLKMLIQFDRASGRFNVQFEDKDPKRWAVTPADIHGFIESLRPKFE